jgi:DNA-binding winged helix-turn-helix (wHTH) protein
MGTQLNPVVRQAGDASQPESVGFPGRYVRFGNFQVDLQREELYQDNQRVKVQAQVYRALLLLLNRAGDIVSREEVRKWLWPEVFLVNLDANVNTTMNKLRQVLGDSPESPRYIETMPRRGYSFVAAVEFSDRSETMPASASAGVKAATAARQSQRLPFLQRFSAAVRMAGFLIAGILLGAVLMFVWFFAQAKNHRAIQSSRPAAGASRWAQHAGRVRA